MAASEEAYKEAIVEFTNAGGSSVYRRIVQVAFLSAQENGAPSWSSLEDTITRFKRSVETSYSSFAASASFARAIAHYGVIDGRALRDCLEDLDTNQPNFAEAVLAVIAKVNRQKASRTRRASGIRADGTRWGDTYPVFQSVETLVDLAKRGDQKAMAELAMIREAIIDLL